MKKSIVVISLALIVVLFASMAAFGAEFDKTRTISVVSREEGSGTRGAFIELVGIEEQGDNGEKIDMTTVDAIIASGTNIVMTSVASDKYGIGYISLGSLNDTVKAIKVDGVEPAAENIQNGTYKVFRPFNIAYMGELSEVAQDFLNYILSAEGQAVVEENNYIRVSENTQIFEGKNPAGKIVIGGSSSVAPLMEKLKEAYLAINTNAEIEIQLSDSTTGMISAKDGIIDIGMASRELKESELEVLTPVVIANDGIAVIVNLENPVEDLTTEQVRRIYIGQIPTWEQTEIN